jgi:hypothetical protein
MSPPLRDSSAAAVLPAAEDDDPVWRAFLAAPVDDEPVTDEQRAAVAEALASGEWIDGDVVTAGIEVRRPR